MIRTYFISRYALTGRGIFLGKTPTRNGLCLYYEDKPIDRKNGIPFIMFYPEPGKSHQFAISDVFSNNFFKIVMKSPQKGDSDILSIIIGDDLLKILDKPKITNVLEKISNVKSSKRLPIGFLDFDIAYETVSYFVDFPNKKLNIYGHEANAVASVITPELFYRLLVKAPSKTKEVFDYIHTVDPNFLVSLSSHKIIFEKDEEISWIFTSFIVMFPFPYDIRVLFNILSTVFDSNPQLIFSSLVGIFSSRNIIKQVLTKYEYTQTLFRYIEASQKTKETGKNINTILVSIEEFVYELMWENPICLSIPQLFTSQILGYCDTNKIEINGLK